MNNQETPITDQEQRLRHERSVHPDTQEQAVKPSGATAPPIGEQYGRPSMPPPFVPPVQPPSSWPGYYPGAGPQGIRGGQFGSDYPRRRSQWPWIVLTFFLLFILLIGSMLVLLSVTGYNLATSSVTETRHFSVSANPRLVLNNDTGSIHVRATGSRSDVTIQAIKHSGPGGKLNDVKVSYTQNTEGNIVTVNVDRPTNFNFVTSTSVEFEVTVPTMATLQLKTNTGSIDVRGVSGQMALTSNTGSIEARDGMVSGTTQLLTNTGSITFTGSIERSGTYRFETNTGSVDVTLPSVSVFHVDASTDTGSINTNFPAVNVQHHQFTGADAHGDVGNSPQATVSLRTNTGSITLYQG